MIIPKSSKVIMAFSDGSYLIAELSRQIHPSDNIVQCSNVSESPKSPAGPKSSIANILISLNKANPNQELFIPLTRIIGIGVLEEQLSVPVAKDVQEMWKE